MGGSFRVTLADGVVDGESSGDHEGAGRALPVGVEGGEKSEILDVVCAVTGFNRGYARRVLKQALRPRVVKPRTPRPPKYDAKVVAGLQKAVRW